jgi:hypothetical protein
VLGLRRNAMSLRPTNTTDHDLTDIRSRPPSAFGSTLC